MHEPDGLWILPELDAENKPLSLNSKLNGAYYSHSAHCQAKSTTAPAPAMAEFTPSLTLAFLFFRDGKFGITMEAKIRG